MRKDRYSSLAYNYLCANELEQELRPDQTDTQDLLDMFVIKNGGYKRNNFVFG